MSFGLVLIVVHRAAMLKVSKLGVRQANRDSGHKTRARRSLGDGATEVWSAAV